MAVAALAEVGISPASKATAKDKIRFESFGLHERERIVLGTGHLFSEVRKCALTEWHV